MNMPPDGAKDKIRRFVLEKLSLEDEAVSVADGDSLVSTGIVDSLGIFQLVAFLEQSFGIRIGDDEILAENFRSIDAIEAFVGRKSGGTGR